MSHVGLSERKKLLEKALAKKADGNVKSDTTGVLHRKIKRKNESNAQGGQADNLQESQPKSPAKKKCKVETSSKGVITVEETGKSRWDQSFDYASFVKEHFGECEKDMEVGCSGMFEVVARNVGVFSLHNVVMVEVLSKKYDELKKSEATLKRDVDSWKEKATSFEGKLTLALEDKKKVDDAKVEADKELVSLKEALEKKDQKMSKLKEDLSDEKLESILSFHNGFERARSQVKVLYPDADHDRLNEFKVVENGDLVDEPQPQEVSDS